MFSWHSNATKLVHFTQQKQVSSTAYQFLTKRHFLSVLLLILDWCLKNSWKEENFTIPCNSLSCIVQITTIIILSAQEQIIFIFVQWWYHIVTHRIVLKDTKKSFCLVSNHEAFNQLNDAVKEDITNRHLLLTAVHRFQQNYQSHCINISQA